MGDRLGQRVRSGGEGGGRQRGGSGGRRGKEGTEKEHGKMLRVWDWCVRAVKRRWGGGVKNRMAGG